MLTLTIPSPFAVGDTVTCHVNGEPTTVEWVAEKIIRLGDSDVRTVLRIGDRHGVLTVTCGEAGKCADDYIVDGYRDDAPIRLK